MRVTNKMLANNFLADMTRNLSNLQTLQSQLSSGKEIRRPSDDPFKVARAMQLHTDINTNKQYNENIKDTINWLDTTDTALNQMGNQMKRVRELLVSAGNPGYGPDERKKIKDEINEIAGQFSNSLNVNFDGKYIFGGTRATTKPVTVIKGPATTSVEGPAAINENIPGTGKVNGSNYSASINKDFKVEIGTVTSGKVDSVFVNGNEIYVDATGSFEIGDGLKFSIDDSDGNATGMEYKFSAIAKDNSKIVYMDRNGEVLPEPTIAKVSDLDKWRGKEIVFNNGGEEVKITLDSDIRSIEELKDNINKKVEETPLKGKLSIEMVQQGDISCIKFVNEADEKDIIISGASTVDDLKDVKGKKVSNNQLDLIDEKLVTEISQGVRIEYNVTATEVLKFKDNSGKEWDVRKILEKITNDLDNNNAEALTGEDLEAMDAVLNNILKIRSQVGARQNSMDGAKDRNTEENFNMTEILSKTEDINLTEKTMEYAVAQTVYIAALQTSARVLQPTLMDYIR